jgi:hypothetical protein
MNTIKISLFLFLCCTTISAQNNNNMDKLTQAVIEKDAGFLDKNLTPENINLIYDFSVVQTMNVHLSDGTERSDFYVTKHFLDVPLLYFYIHWGQFELAELVIENGADVNMKAKDGESILEFAERRGTPKIASMLRNNDKLNEKWTTNYKTEDAESQKTGAIEIEFRSDGTFRYDERYPGESISYANGTYYYIEQTGEIFVHIESGGYDWITRPATETMPPLYWGEVYFNYQFYFKIAKRSDSTVTVIEHISNHEGVSNTAIWEENNGSCSLTTTDPSMMEERQYTVDSLAESDYFR